MIVFTDDCGQYEHPQDGRSQAGEYQIVFGSLWVCRVDPIIGGVATVVVVVVGHLEEDITGDTAVIPLTTSGGGGSSCWRAVVVAIVQ